MNSHTQLSDRVQPPANTNMRASGQLAGRNVLFQHIVSILSSSITRPLALQRIDSLCTSGMERTNPSWHSQSTQKKKKKKLKLHCPDNNV